MYIIGKYIFICTFLSLWQAFLSCFPENLNEFYIFRQYVYVHYIYPAMSKKPKITVKLSKKSVVLIVFFMVSSVKSTIILLPFLTITQHESGTSNIIS